MFVLSTNVAPSINEVHHLLQSWWNNNKKITLLLERKKEDQKMWLALKLIIEHKTNETSFKNNKSNQSYDKLIHEDDKTMTL
jgi:hypothetical protein